MTLRKPFNGTNLPALVNKIVRDNPTPIKANVSSNVNIFIADLLQKDPNMRPYASEVMDTVTDLIYKTQANLYTMDDVFGQNEDVMSGDITNGYGLAPQRLQKFGAKFT